MLTIPSEYAYEELLKYLETFVLDETVTPDGKKIVLFIKLLPELFVSILNGVPLELIIRNPKIEEYSVTLYIKDIEEAPYFITKTIKNMEPDIVEGMNNTAIKLFEHTEIIVSLIDEQMQTKLGFLAKMTFEEINLSKWLSSTKIHHKRNDYFPEKLDWGYSIKINYQITDDFTFMNMRKIRNWDEQTFYSIATNKFNKYFVSSNYKELGKQGYLQEQSLKEFLGDIFTPNFYLYYSLPRPNNPHEELTDFLIYCDYTILLIESKCLRGFVNNSDSIKKIKSSEYALINLIEKAATQLNKAQKDLTDSRYSFEFGSLIEQLMYAKTFIKICIVSDTSLINFPKLERKLSVFQREDLPLILGLNDFYSIFLTFEKEKAMQIFKNMRDNFIESRKIKLPIFRCGVEN